MESLVANTTRYSLYYLFTNPIMLDELDGRIKISNEHADWKITILLGIILGAIVYGSVKVVQMGGLHP